MKRTIYIAFTAFYLMVSMGLSLNLHYCGGKLAGVSIVMPSAPCCCNSEENKSCCADTEISLQMDMDQQISYPPSWELDLLVLSQPDIISYNSYETVVPKKIFPIFPNPPPISSNDRRIAIGSLTFYA